MKVDDGVGAFELKTRVNSLFIIKKRLTAFFAGWHCVTGGPTSGMVSPRGK